MFLYLYNGMAILVLAMFVLRLVAFVFFSKKDEPKKIKKQPDRRMTARSGPDRRKRFRPPVF
jgi:cytochrome bd-type quinol oxidase subunit 2